MAPSASVKSYQVDITTNPNAIIVTPEPIASFVPEGIPVRNIVSVGSVFFDYSTVEANDSGDQFKETYPYPTMTKLVLELINDIKVEFELQSITNQATWSNGTIADLQQAVTDINALL